MAALKLRMPSPRPLPTAENLLVPKSRSAIAITNNQCHGENSPINPPRNFQTPPVNTPWAGELPVKSLGHSNFGVKELLRLTTLQIIGAYQAVLAKSML